MNSEVFSLGTNETVDTSEINVKSVRRVAYHVAGSGKGVATMASATRHIAAALLHVISRVPFAPYRPVARRPPCAMRGKRISIFFLSYTRADKRYADGPFRERFNNREVEEIHDVVT